MQKLFHLLCQRVSRMPLVNVPGTQELDHKFHSILLRMARHEPFLHAWLISSQLQQDLELLFSLNIPSNGDWEMIIQHIWRPNCPETEPLKQHFQQEMATAVGQYEQTQDFLN